MARGRQPGLWARAVGLQARRGGVGELGLAQAGLELAGVWLARGCARSWGQLVVAGEERGRQAGLQARGDSAWVGSHREGSSQGVRGSSRLAQGMGLGLRSHR